jgi:hypothetical protein
MVLIYDPRRPSNDRFQQMPTDALAWLRVDS